MCKVRKAIHNKKRDDSMMMLDLNDQATEQIDSTNDKGNKNSSNDMMG